MARSMMPDSFEPDDANVVDPLVLAERRAQRAELAEQVASRRAADAQALAAELSAERARLEAELEQARQEPERLSRLVAERERALRLAEQRAHAEEAQRLETADELSERSRRHEAELAALRDELARARAEAERERSELEARVAEAEAAATRELEARLAQAEAEAGRARAELETRLARAEADAERAQAAVAERDAQAQAEAERAEAAVAELRERVERAESAATRQGKELAALRGQLDEAEQVASAAETARKRAEAKRAAAREKRRRALEARDAARAEADAAREGADAVMAEAAHVRAERDALRAELAEVAAERDALRSRPAETAPPAGQAPVPDWSSGLRAELALARAAAAARLRSAGAFTAQTGPDGAADRSPRQAGDVRRPSGALERERRLVARRAAAVRLSARDATTPRAQPPGAGGAGTPSEAGEGLGPALAARRGPVRATPITALALERERSVRLQAQLDRQAATERALRAQIEALEHAVQARVEAEAKIERALRRVRGELEAANALRTLTARQPSPRPAAPEQPVATPAAPAPDVPPTPPAEADSGPSAAELAAALDAARAERLAAALAQAQTASSSADDDTPGGEEPAAAAPDAPSPERPPHPALDTGPERKDVPRGVDRDRLSAARARLQATAAPAPASGAAAERPAPAAAAGAPSPWLPDALRRLVREDPDTVGRILVGMLPAQGLVTQRSFACDVVIEERGTVAVDVAAGAATVRPAEGPRPKRQRDVEIATTHAGLGRLLAGRRGLRRRARVRGKHRRVRELRKLARTPLALRDLAGAGAVLEPALAFWLAALAIDPAQTQGHRFTIAHAPLPGGPADAWLRIQDGGALAVMRTKPGEAPAVTLRCTRGALLALLAGVDPPPGEGAAVDGDLAALELLRGWIARTEFPGA